MKADHAFIRPGRPVAGDRTPLKIALIYAVFGFLWILLSDRLAELFFPPASLTQVQTYKGWGFVLLTAVLLFFLARYYLLKVLRLQRASYEEQLRLGTALEQSVDQVFITDPQGRIRHVNAAVEHASGSSRGEISGRPVAEIIGQACRNDGHIWQLVTSGTAWRGPLDTRARNGSRSQSEATIMPVYNADNEIMNVVVVLRDVTHERRIETQLRQSQKMEAIGTLAGGIAHDFNNILTPIIGYTELVVASLPPHDKQADYLKEVLNAAGRAKDMVAQILAFSRQKEQELKPLRLQPIVSEALKLLRSTIPSSIEFKEDIHPECCPVIADPSQVHQIIMNLCTNAFHAMQAHGGVLTVQLVEVDLDQEDVKRRLNLKPGSYLRLSVTDTGVGMDPSQMERIFEPYFTTKPPDQGTGMGLAVVHGIVRSYGGDISVYSEKGHGSTFSVYLPLAGLSAQVAREDQAVDLPRGSEHILLVDDQAEIMRMEQLILEGLGYRVTPMTSGIDALQAFEHNPDAFDLIITDLTMPQLSGIELARKALEIRPAIPVILCTGFSRILHHEQTPGIRDLVMKPVLRSDLARRVRAVLDAA